MATVTVTQENEKTWSVRLDMGSSQPARRRIEGRSCQEVLDAAAVTLALAIAPDNREGGRSNAGSAQPRATTNADSAQPRATTNADSAQPRATTNAGSAQPPPPNADVDRPASTPSTPGSLASTATAASARPDSRAASSARPAGDLRRQEPELRIPLPETASGASQTEPDAPVVYVEVPMGGEGSKRGTNALHASVGADFGADFGMMPSPSWVAGGHVGLRWGRVEAQAIVLAHESKTLTMSPEVLENAGGRFDRITGALSACFMILPTRAELWALDACASGAVTRMEAVGMGATVDGAKQVGTWASIGLGPRLRWSPVRWGTLLGRADLFMPLSRPDFPLRGVRPPVYSVPDAFVLVVLGVEANFF